MAPFFQETYARLGSNLEDGAVRDLSRVFADRREPLYIDWMHPGETGNAVIAQRIARDILATKVALARTASAERAPPRR